MQLPCDTIYIEGEICQYRWSCFDLPLPDIFQWLLVRSDAVQEHDTITITVVANAHWDQENDECGHAAEFDFGPDG